MHLCVYATERERERERESVWRVCLCMWVCVCVWVGVCVCVHTSLLRDLGFLFCLHNLRTNWYLCGCVVCMNVSLCMMWYGAVCAGTLHMWGMCLVTRMQAYMHRMERLGRLHGCACEKKHWTYKLIAGHWLTVAPVPCADTCVKPPICCSLIDARFCNVSPCGRRASMT
jgi:hypothetical protein